MKNLKSRKNGTPAAFWIFVFALAAMAGLLSSCEPANNDAFTQQYVLQGQMYVGQAPVIRLAHTVSLETTYDAAQVGISGADVELTAWGPADNAEHQTFHLVELSADPRGNGYYGLAPADTHYVTPGWHYSIRCAVEGDTITAQTIAAGFVQITRPANDADTAFVMFDDRFAVPIRWAHDDFARGHWIIYENLNPHHADDSTFLCANNSGPDKRVGVYASYWNVPQALDSTNSPPVLFNRNGLHRARVLSCDSALWTYSSTFMPGQADRRPTSNVHGGLGLFSAGGVDTTYFYILKNPAFSCD